MTSATKYCPECGRELPAEARFCTGCGTGFTTVAETPEPIVAPASEQQAAQNTSPEVTALSIELQRLSDQLESGSITQETYESSKAQALATFANARQQANASAAVQQAAAAPDTGGFGWAALGFFFPMVGLILYLVWKDDRPITAKAAGKGALIGVIVSVVLSVLLGILSAVLPLIIMNSYY